MVVATVGRLDGNTQDEQLAGKLKMATDELKAMEKKIFKRFGSIGI